MSQTDLTPETEFRGIGTFTSTRTVRPPAPAASTPLVSVVIPCFNYAAYLPQAVMSVLRQTGVRTEVIIVDDCSTDASLAVARDLAARHSTVRVIEHAINRGPVETFNGGLAAASGEYLVRLDADDLLTPGSLKRAVAVLDAYPSVGLVYGHPLHFEGHLPKPRTRTRAVTLWPGLEWLSRRCRDGLNVITSPEVVMRRSVVDEVGGQQPLAHTHDMEMWLRIAAFSDVAYLRGCDQAWHREHGQSLSARKVDSFVDLDERRQAFDMLASGIAGRLPGVAELCAAADRALDRQSIAIARHDLDLGDFSAGQVERFLTSIRSTDLEADVEAVRRRAARAATPADRIGALRRRTAHRLRWERSFRTWHRRGEF